MYLCFNTPAAPDYNDWQKKSVPMGNGSVGARIFGGVQCEVIQFNENTLFSGDENRKGSFQNFGEILINFNTPVPCSENTYLRDLDLETGSAMVACRKGLDGHTRHYFISAADNVFVGKIEATGDTLLDFTVSVQSEQNGKTEYSGAYAFTEGNVKANNGAGKEDGEDKNSLKYSSCIKVLTEDGKIETTGSGITVTDTFSALIIMSCATSFFSENDLMKSRQYVDLASERTFPSLFKRHLDDYQSVTGRARLNIGQNEENVTTASLIKAYSKGRERANLEALLFDMGKYVLYTSSRRASLPVNESGIWNSLNNREDGEILIDAEKVSRAHKTAHLLSMPEVVTDFPFAFDTSGKRFNPFGFTVESEKPAVEKPSFASRLFRKEKNPANAGEALEKAAELSKKDGNGEKAYSLLYTAASSVYENLLMPDIFDSIMYSHTVCSLLLSLTADGVIRFLPSLPPMWKSGSLGYIHTENGFEVKFEWSDGKFKSGKIKSVDGGICRIYAHGKFIGVSDENGNDVKEEFTNGTVSFETCAGKEYTLY